MSIPTKESILAYLADIKQELQGDGITELGLFGSYAKDRADIASDIDIMLCTSKEFLRKFQGFESAIYLDELRQRVSKHFRTQVDICDTASMSQSKKESLLTGAIYV